MNGQVLSPRVALVHYWLIDYRGGERVLKSIADLFPGADIYTLFYSKEMTDHFFPKNKIYSSVLDRPFLRQRYKGIFPLYPLAVKSLKLANNYDLIISSESGPAKGIANPQKIPHICYIHTPMRYCWGQTEDYLKRISTWLRPLAKFFFQRLREWDKKTVNSPNLYLANSENVKERVKKYYGKSAEVVYPFVESKFFAEPLLESKSEDYLFFGAITPYKNLERCISVFNKNNKPLLVAGSGDKRYLDHLRTKANSNIRFLGNVSESEKIKLLASAKALIYPQIEDFGIVPLEAMAMGTPVIALGEGGALETVIGIGQSNFPTGILYKSDSDEELEAAVQYLEKNYQQFLSEQIRSRAKEFSEDLFHSRFKHWVETVSNIRF